MTSHLLKNGEVHCDIISSQDHPLPKVQEHCWHDCTLVTVQRIEARPADLFSVVIPGREGLPFLFSRCRVAVEGWEVEGKVLF